MSRKLSMFNRFSKREPIDSELAGISEEEVNEYKEAFRLFDKVRI
jgi:Ca2+-binding EF-hand superfamily protein